MQWPNIKRKYRRQRPIERYEDDIHEQQQTALEKQLKKTLMRYALIVSINGLAIGFTLFVLLLTQRPPMWTMALDYFIIFANVASIYFNTNYLVVSVQLYGAQTTLARFEAMIRTQEKHFMR